MPCLACHEIHRKGEPLAPRRDRKPVPGRDQETVRPSLRLVRPAGARARRPRALPLPAMLDGDRPVKMSPDRRQALCYQCHAPRAGAAGRLGRRPDAGRRPRGPELPGLPREARPDDPCLLRRLPPAPVQLRDRRGDDGHDLQVARRAGTTSTAWPASTATRRACLRKKSALAPPCSFSAEATRWRARARGCRRSRPTRGSACCGCRCAVVAQHQEVGPGAGLEPPDVRQAQAARGAARGREQGLRRREAGLDHQPQLLVLEVALEARRRPVSVPIATGAPASASVLRFALAIRSASR